MSVIFGTLLPRVAAVDETWLHCVSGATLRYGIDGTQILSQGRVGMGFQAFHTHNRSRLDQQPTVDHLGNMITLDGRLDNYRDLATTLGMNGEASPDCILILKAFERWGADCFSRFLGDWALVIWSPKDCVLYLARDHAGTRNLFYSLTCGHTSWSTHLETFLESSVPLELDQEYMARTLACQQTLDLTPFRGIRAVPPAHYVAIQNEREVVRPHWRWVADTENFSGSDGEYDEQFLHLFHQAVQRRYEQGGPILAELSGGMDSSAIVCMADRIAHESIGSSDLIQTVSYYDDTEPDWNERPYFSAVEKHRNKVGVHLDCSSRVPTFEPLTLPERFYPYPGGDSASIEYASRFEDSVGAGRYRVILSGIGGDELLGGVPTPLPELANYLMRGKFFSFVAKAFAWSMVDLRPILHTVASTVAFTSALYFPQRVRPSTIPRWIAKDLRQFCLNSPSYLRNERQPFRVRPSAIDAGLTWWSILGSLPHLAPPLLGPYEYRYPYLDRDLVEFLHRIPRGQLVRPGRRRLLMRRALTTMVPTEILERKRKALISRAPISHFRDGKDAIRELFSSPLVADLGFIDRDEFLRAFDITLAGDLQWIGHLTTVINMEVWLRGFHLYRGGVNSRTPLSMVLN